jgi:pantoate--beta-alanine ligase
VKRLERFADVRRERWGTTALVPTMGFLHEGHLSLIEAAAAAANTVIVSLFVNPLQFDDPADLDRYPRDPGRDAALAEEAGATTLFAPPAEEMYPRPPAARVSPGPPAAGMEGARRPGHFEGVATVVAKLFAGLQPERAYFGRKDAQQLVVVSRMAADLSFPVEVIGGPTVREQDGLALSSRNVLLAESDRAAALALSRGLMAAASAAEIGERSGASLEGVVADEVAGSDLAGLEYAVLADAADAARISRLDRPAFLAAAIRIGGLRLLDNVWLLPDGTADRGTTLEHPSILYRGGP